MEPAETIETDSEVLSCDGGGGALGHPRVYRPLKFLQRDQTAFEHGPGRSRVLSYARGLLPFLNCDTEAPKSMPVGISRHRSWAPPEGGRRRLPGCGYDLLPDLPMNKYALPLPGEARDPAYFRVCDGVC